MNPVLAPLGAFSAGLLSSVGPCVAPRYLGLAALIGVGSRRTRLRLGAAFVVGVIGGFVALGTGGLLLATALANSRLIYALLSVSLIGMSLWGLCSAERSGSCCDGARPSRSLGGALLLGAASTLVISPCCAPLLLAFGGVGAFVRDPAARALLLAAFACGHAAPLALAACASSITQRILGSALVRTTLPTISCGLAFALGAYYGLLA